MSATQRDNRARVGAVLFDFADTLVKGVPNWEYPQIVACREAGRVVPASDVNAAIWKVWGPLEGCAHVDASVDEATYRHWIGTIERQILANLDLPEDELDRATARVIELQLAPASYRIYPEVQATLATLRARGLRLGVISNFSWGLPDLVAGLGLASFFDRVITSARVGYRKPRAEIFHAGLAQLGVSAEEAIFVGDDPECDYRGALSVGMRPLLVDRRGRGDDSLTRILDLSGVLSYISK